MSLSVSKDKGTLIFKGAIDDDAQLGAIPSTSGSVTINFRGVTSINSLGVRKYLDFVDSWRSLKVTYEDVPHVLVDAFLMLPALLGPQENTAQIVSLQVSYLCSRCKDSNDLFLKTDDLSLKQGELAFPVRVCPSCTGYLSVDDQAYQIFEFVELGAMKIKAAK